MPALPHITPAAAFLAALAAAAAGAASGSPLKGCDSQMTYYASPVDVDLPVPVVPHYSICSIANHLTATLPASDSAPLFDAAILESSGVHFGYTYNWTTIYGTITAGLFSVTGCKDIGCLRGLSADALRAAQNVMEANGATFRPYVDGDYIPTNPQKRLLSGDFMQVPVLVGTNTDEGTFFTSTTTPDQYSALVDKAFPGLPSSLTTTIYSLYPLNNYTATIFGATAAPFLASADLIGDWALHCPSQRVADAYSLLSTAVDPADGKPLVYRYHFNHVPTYLPSSLRIFGVAHSFEIPYVFAAPETQASTGEDALAREMVSMWTFFGQSAGRGGLNGWKGQTVDWPKYEAVAALVGAITAVAIATTARSAATPHDASIDTLDGTPLVYRYRFNHLPLWVPTAVLGVAHAYEVPFVFKSLQAAAAAASNGSETMVNGEEWSLSREVVSMWTFFAQTAGQRGMNGWKGQSVVWPKYETPGLQLAAAAAAATVIRSACESTERGLTL
ncbi:Alpha/Beta hydrolase protein [Zopfochytrium polystomum]|nr:Alpha/Beta hydrolase protein [Zopfochytrium polystomum]